MQIAKTASSPTIQQTFFDLARQWDRLASDLDDAYALLEAVNKLDGTLHKPPALRVIKHSSATMDASPKEHPILSRVVKWVGC
jgi:hypothetical protein